MMLGILLAGLRPKTLVKIHQMLSVSRILEIASLIAHIDGTSRAMYRWI